jgi:hypothetical protein
MTNNNKIHNIRIMILVMLFQLLSPAVSALISDPEQGGQFSIVCTVQGYQKVWIASENKQEHSDSINCPVCLLTQGSLDVINSDATYISGVINSHVTHVLTIQHAAQAKVWSSSFAIRAPPFA